VGLGHSRGHEWEGAPAWGKRAYDGIRSPQEVAQGQQTRLERTMARMMDPVRFARDCGMEPDPWQMRYLRSRKKRRILNCSRQVGKSTVAAVRVVHRAIYRPGSLILLVSKGERQSGELMRKVYETYANAEDAVPLVKNGATEMELATGSRIVALPGVEGTVRSYSAVDMLVIDEASRVPDELYVAVRPMLAVSGGSLDALSTPFGTRGWWYDEVVRTKDPLHTRAEGEEPPWDYYEVPATQCPRLPREFLDEEYETLGKWWFNQEDLTMFMDAQGAAFTQAEIDRAFSEDVETWDLGRAVDTMRGTWSMTSGLWQR
jgi:hypothetical protein